MTERSLPPGTPEKDIAHVKLMSLYIKSSGPPDGPTPNLTFHIANTEGGIAGHVLTAGETPESVIETFLAGGSSLVRDPTPLDFPISRKCYIVLRLEGGFWEFSSKRAITTKDDLGDHYYHLTPHVRDGRVAAVSFCARTPFADQKEPELRIRHGFNLHINFIDRDSSGNRRLLPVIIDPDIENRGGTDHEIV